MNTMPQYARLESGDPHITGSYHMNQCRLWTSMRDRRVVWDTRQNKILMYIDENYKELGYTALAMHADILGCFKCLHH